jgi:hypothetical protein
MKQFYAEWNEAIFNLDYGDAMQWLVADLWRR